VNGGRYNPWKDAYGVPIATASRVEQVGVDRSHGAVPRRKGKLGVVTGHGSTRVAVRFDDEEQTTTVAPYLLRVVEHTGSGAVGVTEDLVEGFHWHVYSRTTTEALTDPTPADRRARLAERPDVVLRSPVSVAEWIIPHSGQGERFMVWCPASGRWNAYDYRTGRDVLLHLEAVQLAARAASVYVAVAMSAGQRVEVFAEAVTVFDCPEGGRHDDHERNWEA
jgi:hypothetical protein